MDQSGKEIVNYTVSTSLLFGFKSIVSETRAAFSELPGWEKGFFGFWLLGPFIMLVERTPADAWLTILGLTFLLRSTCKKDFTWLKPIWVKLGLVFWVWCLFTSLISSFPAYSFGEAIVWIRFPLFAVASTYWLARDKRFLHAILFTTALGLITMCVILAAEFLILGNQGGRLSWPYGDPVSGNYVAKVGLPVFTIMVALAVSVNSRVAMFSGLMALATVVISVVTGERINFLIRACGGMLAGLVWKPKWPRYLALVCAEALAVIVVFTLLPDTAARFTTQLVDGVTDFKTSPWWHSLNGGWIVAKDNLMFGIGTANFRLVAPQALFDVPFTRIEPHPHNFYVQIFCETGVIGLCLGTLFLSSITFTCLIQSFKRRNNVIIATAWIVPFGLFWPITTSGDFFGQWNNIFVWSAVAISCAACGNIHAGGSQKRMLNKVSD